MTKFKLNVYDFENTAINKNKKIIGYLLNLRVFTRVWGGTLNQATKSEIEHLGHDWEQYNAIYENLIQSIPNIQTTELLAK